MRPTLAKKLDNGERHFLRLIAKGQEKYGGWAKVSKPLYPLVQKMPVELVEHEPRDDGCGRARLTQRGAAILDAIAWL
jgi:hypothetical protein